MDIAFLGTGYFSSLVVSPSCSVCIETPTRISLVVSSCQLAPTSIALSPEQTMLLQHHCSRLLTAVHEQTMLHRKKQKKRLNWMNWWSSVVSLYYISFCRDDDGPGRSPTPAPCRGRSSQPLRHGFGVRLLVTLQPLLGFSVLRLIAEGFIHPVEKSLIAVEHQYALRLKVYTGMFFLLINSCHTIYFADAELLTSLNPFSFSSFEVLDLYRKF